MKEGFKFINAVGLKLWKLALSSGESVTYQMLWKEPLQDRSFVSKVWIHIGDILARIRSRCHHV